MGGKAMPAGSTEDCAEIRHVARQKMTQQHFKMDSSLGTMGVMFRNIYKMIVQYSTDVMKKISN